MKFSREIAAHLSILLLAFANISAYMSRSVRDAPLTVHHEQSQLRAADDALPIYCLTEQRYSAGAGQGNGVPNFKYPVGFAPVKNFSLNASLASGADYYLLSKYLLIGFPSTDVIYPFHQFW
ncbi:MAG: hypothetical protein GC192_12890 [Bacteroidetes bacterium]|nr:hypothetical protein [Bacteroidota bacterium]